MASTSSSDAAPPPSACCDCSAPRLHVAPAPAGRACAGPGRPRRGAARRASAGAAPPRDLVRVLPAPVARREGGGVVGPGGSRRHDRTGPGRRSTDSASRTGWRTAASPRRRCAGSGTSSSCRPATTAATVWRRWGAFVFRRGFLQTSRGSAIGWSRVGLSRLNDPAAREFLAARGGRVVAGAAVAEAAGPGGVTPPTGRRCRPTRSSSPCRWPGLARRGGAGRGPGLGASPIVNVHVWYDRPVMDERFTAVVDSPVQWIFNRTAMGGDGSSHHLAISISGARDEVEVPRAELAEAMRAELEHLLPAPARQGPAPAVVKEPQATFAAAPGQAARRPGPATPLERRPGRRVGLGPRDGLRPWRARSGRHRRRPACPRRPGAAVLSDEGRPAGDTILAESANWHAAHRPIWRRRGGRGRQLRADAPARASGPSCGSGARRRSPPGSGPR